MPQPRPQIELSTLAGGINRYEQEASANQAVDALDVTNDDGDLRRRDAFVSIATAAPFDLPRPVATVIKGTSGGSFSTLSNRAGTVTLNELYVGYTGAFGEVFDGIDFREITFSGTNNTANIYVKPYYYSGTTNGWRAVPWWRDETIGPTSGAYAQSLVRNGRISWHRDCFRVDTTIPGSVTNTTDWSSSSVNSVQGYWIKLAFLRADTGAAIAPTGTITIAAPGVGVFRLQSINGLFPSRLKTHRVLLVGSDRRGSPTFTGGLWRDTAAKRGLEQGGKLGAFRYNSSSTDQLALVEDEGAGVFDVQTFPKWQKGGVDVGSTQTRGTANKLTKDDQSYSWTNNQFFGDSVAEGAAGVGGVVSNFDTTTNSFDCTFTSGAIAANRYDKLVLTFTSGANSGSSRMVLQTVTTGNGGFITEAFGSVIGAGDVFRVQRVVFVRFRQSRDQRFWITAQAAQTVTLSSTVTWAHAATSAGYTGKPVHFEIVRDCEQAIPDGEHWSACYDTVTGQLIATNGKSGLLAYDGVRLRRLAADTTSELAKQYTGVLPDRPDIVGGNDPTLTPESQLETAPPSGKYIIDFGGRFVVAGFPGRPNDVQWSAPGGANNIWPKVFHSKIRDSKNDPITGLATLGDRVYVFTRSAIHEGSVADSRGFISFTPIAQGAGFVSHHAVGKIVLNGQDALCGAAPDGVYIMSGGEPAAVLPQWDRLVPGGVNEALLHRAVATVLPQRKRFILAVASRGSGFNDRLIVFDYDARRWWLWSAPYGVSALATETTETGVEALLLGSDDGFVSTLLDAPDDDGRTISAYARSVPVQPFQGRRGSFARLGLTMLALGNAQTIEVQSFIDRRDSYTQKATLPVASGETTFPVTVTSYLASSTFSDRRFKTISVPLRVGTSGDVFQYRVGGSSRWRIRAAFLEARAIGSGRR